MKYFPVNRTTTTALFVLGLVLVSYIVSRTMLERFEPQMLNQSQEKRTMEREDSSFEQRTNHFRPGPVDMGPLHGTESPFRVNQYKAYIP
jgi:hypothetical protein